MMNALVKESALLSAGAAARPSAANTIYKKHARSWKQLTTPAKRTSNAEAPGFAQTQIFVKDSISADQKAVIFKSPY